MTSTLGPKIEEGLPRALPPALDEVALPAPLFVERPDFDRSDRRARALLWGALSEDADLLSEDSAPATFHARWPVSGERAWPTSWASIALTNPDDARLRCGDALDISRWGAKGLKVGELRTLFKTSALANVVNLWLRCCPVRGKWHADLAKHSHRMTTLRYLNLHATNLDGAAAVGFARGGFEKLERLELGFNRIRNDVAAMLDAAAVAWPALHALSLRNVGLTDEGATMLAASSKAPPALRALSLSGNDLSARGLAALLDGWGPLRALEHLDISVTKIGDEGLVKLAHSENVAGLTSLACGGAMTGADADGVRAVLGSERLGKLRALDLSNVRLGEAWPDLLDAPLIPQLQRIALNASGMWRDQVAPALSKLTGVTELHFDNNSMAGDHIDFMIERMPNLRRLSVVSNLLTAPDLERLLAESSLKTLTASFHPRDDATKARLIAIANERAIALELR